ncbi:MAG: hypothetical protein AB7V44_03495 [Pseudonocardia sp.]
MTRPRRPVVAGLTAGAGTTTFATVLHGVDGGVGGHGADLLVVRDDPASLRLLSDTAVGAGTVAAVVLGPDTPAPSAERAVRAAVHVVAVPHVAALAEGRVPRAHLEMLLAREPGSLPIALRPYAEALARVAAALVAGGRLDRGPACGVPPVASSSLPAGRDVGAQPIGAAAEPVGVPVGVPDDLDDEALERATG